MVHQSIGKMMPESDADTGTRAIELPEPSAEKLNVQPLHPGVLGAAAFVHDHFHEKFPARDIAAHCGLSRFQFSRSFHAVFGITFREYLLRYRIRAACERLLAGDLPVTEVAFAVGFHDGSYFARMFRRYTGVLPSQYARAHASQPRA